MPTKDSEKGNLKVTLPMKDDETCDDKVAPLACMYMWHCPCAPLAISPVLCLLAPRSTCTRVLRFATACPR
eukprot:2018524-Prymnesium_polylepis.2